MNDNNKHSKQYSAEDIQRYLKGQMTPQEMHAIETAALDDPFLADAIEGFETALKEGNEELIKGGLGKLNEQFEKRIKQPGKVVPMIQSRWWKIAAVASILVITGVAFYNNWVKPEKTNEALALNEKKQIDSPDLQKTEVERTTAFSAVTDTVHNQDKKPLDPPPISKQPVTSPVAGRAENEAGNKLVKKKTPSPENDDLKRDDQAFQNTERSGKTKEEVSNKPSEDRNVREPQAQAAPIYNNEAHDRKAKQSLSQLNNFSGRVVDPNNKPLANANLQILQNRTSLTTDQSGGFNFTNKDSFVDVQVALPGFEQRNFRLQNSIASNNIILEPVKEALDEVVVSGYGSARKKDVTKTTVKVQDAVPQIGWIEYEKYLDKNKKPPANNPLMKGEVVVSFQVKREGDLTDFKIEKSLSKDYDKEAIRLIQEGPAWKLLNSRRTRITVIVKF